MFIKAPYNFVPLNKKVVIPHWGTHISHDIPFTESYSGDIQIRIKAHSPIFVMDGTKEAKSNAVKQFSRFGDTYLIPGSSIKGMIRNVLEIMSFCKLGNKVNDHRYAVRDLSPAAKNIYLDHFKAQDIQAGWLRKNEDERFVIEDCGNPGRISHRELDDHFKTDFDSFFSADGPFNARDDRQKAAQFKYRKFDQHPRKHRFTFVKDSAGRLIFEVDSNGEKEGTIVFTGQPGPRKQNYSGRWSGHHLEFIFFEPRAEITVPETVMDNFFFAYHEHDINRHSIDWKVWRVKLYKGEKIPIFFRKSEDGQILDLGLSFLYKLPYKNSIKQAISHFQDQEEQRPDLSEAIFGYVNTDNRATLKGRVQIGHAQAIHAEEENEPKSEVLSGPKASYYPNYIRQSIGPNGKLQRRYVTLMDDKPEIAGWKRYPIHKHGVRSNPLPKGVSQDVLSHFIPIKSGAEFSFTLRYHNLKKVELGALLSAITFHNTPDAYHSLGMAKSLGYGKISLTIENLSTDQLVDYLQAYEAYMDAALGHEAPGWSATEQLTELLSMVSEQNNTGNSELSYMRMDMGRNGNHFVEAKKANEALGKYSNLEGVKKRSITSLINLDDLRQAQQTIDEETAIFQQKEASSTASALEELRNNKQLEFYNLLEERKAALIRQLEQKREEIRREELAAEAALQEAEAKKRREEQQLAQEKKREEIQQATQNTPPPLEAIDPTDRNAFDQLKRELQIYLPRYHGARNYDDLKAEFPQGGMLPEEFREPLEELVLKMFASASKKEQKRWTRNFDKNAILKKIGEWIGEERARILLNTMEN